MKMFIMNIDKESHIFVSNNICECVLYHNIQNCKLPLTVTFEDMKNESVKQTEHLKKYDSSKDIMSISEIKNTKNLIEQLQYLKKNQKIEVIDLNQCELLYNEKYLTLNK